MNNKKYTAIALIQRYCKKKGRKRTAEVKYKNKQTW